MKWNEAPGTPTLAVAAPTRPRRPPARAVGGRALAVALAMAAVGAAGAAPREEGVAPSLPIGRVTHASRASADERDGDAARVPDAAAPVPERGATTVVGRGGGGALTIDVTFDDSITGDPDAAAIEAMIADAVAVHESLFDDPVSVSIRFRYATTYADGTTPLPPGMIAVSESCIYRQAWNAYLGALTADATTANDAVATASLPAAQLSTRVDPTSATGRAVGLATAPVMFADGSVGPGGPYDGIVTIDARQPLSFTRPPAHDTYDAQRSVEHEIDEVLGLGSDITVEGDLRPEALFGWSAPGVRNLTSTGSRYFSIDGGATEIVGFNQDPGGDSADWLSGPCPQTTPYVQNAFSCKEQVSDVTPTSPEAIALDVIGWDLIAVTTTTTPATSTTTTTLPLCPPSQVECCPVGQPGCGACGIDCGNGGCCPTSLPVCDNADLLCLAEAPSGPDCAPDQAPCTDAALGFADVACCAVPTTRRQCAAACSEILGACKASCATTRQPNKCRRRCQKAIVGRCRQSRPHACG